MAALFGRTARVVIDLTALSAAFWSAFLFHLDFHLSMDWLKVLFFTWPYVVVFQFLLMMTAGVPRMAWRYVSLGEAARILGALVTAQLVLVALSLIVGPFGGYARFVALPVGILLSDLALAFLAVTGVRVLRRLLAERSERRVRVDGCHEAPRRTLLLGAGRAGMLVAREIAQRPDLGIEPVGFIDDDPLKRGTVIQGIPVIGDSGSLETVARRLRAEQALITIAATSGDVVARLNQACSAIQLPVKIIPAIYDILDGKLDLGAIREVTIEDLLGREAVQLDQESLSALLAGRTVMVTGAGGSIGSELCRQIVRFAPERLLLVEQAEPALFTIHKELADGAVDVVPCICDVTDRQRVARLFHRYQPHVVFHAAAHKHVPMMEWNPGEAVKNNVFGTRVVADLADRYGVDRFVLVSTDKAVNPTSVMGATKRIAEIYIQALASRSSTRFVAVRFGNVLGSAGSVIPIFRDQIRRGGPVTVTHPEMTRYFMTIPEASQLVMQAAELGEGGEIFVLDMGDPVRIVQLARDMIRLSGYTEDDIGIRFTGPRPGEKLFEEFSVDTEQMSKTRHPKIYIGRIGPMPFDTVVRRLDALQGVTQSESTTMVRVAIGRLVPELGEPLDTGLDEAAPAVSGVTSLFH